MKDQPPVPGRSDWAPLIAAEIINNELLKRVPEDLLLDTAPDTWPWATADEIGRGLAIAAECFLYDSFEPVS